MRRITTQTMMLMVLAGAGITGTASAQAQNAYLTFANTKVELMATAWGRSDALRRGAHVPGLPRTRPTTLSVLLDSPDEDDYPNVADGGWVNRRQPVTLTIIDAAGMDRVYRLTGVSDLTCNARSRVCSFDFLKIDLINTTDPHD